MTHRGSLELRQVMQVMSLSGFFRCKLHIMNHFYVINEFVSVNITETATANESCCLRCMVDVVVLIVRFFER